MATQNKLIIISEIKISRIIKNIRKIVDYTEEMLMLVCAGVNNIKIAVN